jgi:cytochrome c
MKKNWCHAFTGLTFLGCLLIALSSCKKSESQTTTDGPPEENRFTTTIMSQPGELDEPMAFTFLDQDRMLVVERKGGVKLFNTSTRVMKTIATIPVNTKYTNAEGQVREAEEGLMGVIADPNFEQNRWVYLFYADPDTPKHVLARWEFRDDALIESIKKTVLSFPTQRQECCHTGGGMVFDSDGNLYLTTGNNTVNPPTGTSNLDERPGRKLHDDQRTGGNTNDLRGKILRIHPEADGSYTIPQNNLFPPGTEKGRAEIYTMGHRNPWRVSLDSKTGYLYWGEVGPDASQDSDAGPRGYDEYNQAREAGFFGWPYFIGDNKPYTDYDFATEALGEAFDTANVINDSPNNTGLQKLPAPQKAFIWYPYANSEEFPEVGSSGRSATGGPVFRSTDFPASERQFPAYYEGKWLIVEFMRGWIMSVSMDDNGDYQGMERFLPDEDFQSAIDIKFSPQGDLYVLEYGSAWFRGNVNAQIKRIEYNGGNRTPVVVASADKIAGAIPLTVQLTSEGTMDYDDDALRYEWNIRSDHGYQRSFEEANAQLTLDKEGAYEVSLKVTDQEGSSNTRTFEILAGNEPPMVDIELLEGNQSFFFPGAKLEYRITVSDREDGSTTSGQIDKSQVAINFDYAPEGFDPIEIAQNHRATDEWTTFSKGAVLINQNDCRSCHLNEQKSVGPSYREVATKYQGNRNQQRVIAQKIITGGSGVWGDHAMSAHPELSDVDAELMVSYIMSLNSPATATKTYPLEGSLVTAIPKGDNGKGGYLLRAAYADGGNGEIKSLASEKIIPLRHPILLPESYDMGNGIQLLTTPRNSFNLVGDKAYLAFKDIDLTGISQIEFMMQAPSRIEAAGCLIEVRLDTPEGPIIGQTDHFDSKDVSRAIATLENTQGKHDVFLVCRNAAAREGQVLVQMQSLEFFQAKEVR